MDCSLLRRLLLKSNLTYYFSPLSQAVVRRPATRFFYSRPRLLPIPGNLSHIKTSLSKNGQASAPAMQMWANPARARGVRARPPDSQRPFSAPKAPLALHMETEPGPDRLRRAPPNRGGGGRGGDLGTELPPACNTLNRGYLELSGGFSSPYFSSTHL